MEITKFKSAEVAYHIKHDLRALPEGKSYGNESIDKELSKNNYSLIDRGKTSAKVNKYRKEIEKEIFKYNRKDVVHAVEVCIQCPSDCPEEEKERFFKESYKYIVSTLPMGEKCVFVAQVHKDEKHRSPSGEMISKDHLHIMYVPAVLDTKHEGFNYKLCADQLTKRANLKALHPGLQEHLNKCGIQATVYRKKEGDGKQIPLTVKQLKELTAATGITLDKGVTVQQLAEIINKNVEYSKQLETVKKILGERDKTIQVLTEELERKNIINQQKSVDLTTEKDNEINLLKEKLSSMQEAYKSQEKELQESKAKIQELENKQKAINEEKEASWGNDNSWGNGFSNWGKHEKEEEKTW